MTTDSQKEKDPKLEEAKKILAKVGVQAQPKILIEINRLARSEDVNFDLIADLVAQDVGISAKMLKLASSPIYSKGQKFNSVNEALMAIGFKEFQSCFTSVTLHDIMGKVGYPYKGFWEHSRNVAVYCQEIATKLAPKYAANAYTLGLFHDVGAVLIPLYNRQYIDHIQRALPLYFGITDLEFKLVKTNHCAVGEMFVRNWGLEPDILFALRYHHRSELEPPMSQTAMHLKLILQLAELMNDKIEGGSEEYAPFAGTKEVLENIATEFDLVEDELPLIEADLINAKKQKLAGV